MKSWRSSINLHLHLTIPVGHSLLKSTLNVGRYHMNSEVRSAFKWQAMSHHIVQHAVNQHFTVFKTSDLSGLGLLYFMTHNSHDWIWYLDPSKDNPLIDLDCEHLIKGIKMRGVHVRVHIKMDDRMFV